MKSKCSQKIAIKLFACYHLGKIINQKIDVLPENEDLLERIFVIFLKQMYYSQVLERIGKGIPPDLFKILKNSDSEVLL